MKMNGGFLVTKIKQQGPPGAAAGHFCGALHHPYLCAGCEHPQHRGRLCRDPAGNSGEGWRAAAGCDEQAPPDFRSPAGEPAGGIGPHQGERLPRQGRCFWWRHVGRGRARHGTMRMSRQTRWLLSPPAKARGKQRLFPRKQKERQVLKNDACCCYTCHPGLRYHRRTGER